MMWFKNNTHSGPLGLVAGQGDFPLLFAQKAVLGGRTLIIVGIEGWADPAIKQFGTECFFLGLGELERFIDLIKMKGIKEIVLAGAVPKKEMYNPHFKPDEATKGFIQNVVNKGDDHMLKAFEILLRLRCGVRVIDSRLFIRDLIAQKGVMTQRRPTSDQWQDLRFGWKIAKGIGKMDIGQTVVIKNGVVLAVEALEGTDWTIRRAAELGKDGVVVVKVCKPNQDVRFDLPCVGLQTLSTLEAAGSHLIGLEAGKTIMLHRQAMIDTANQKGIGIVGL